MTHGLPAVASIPKPRWLIGTPQAGRLGQTLITPPDTAPKKTPYQEVEINSAEREKKQQSEGRENGVGI